VIKVSCEPLGDKCKVCSICASKTLLSYIDKSHETTNYRSSFCRFWLGMVLSMKRMIVDLFTSLNI